MSIKYNVVPKGQPGVVGGGQIKYYATISRSRKVNLDTFIEEIEEMSSITTPDILAVLESFLKRASHHLAQGRPIDMGRLGSFSPTFSSVGVDTPQEVSKHLIKGCRVLFRPSKQLRKKLANVEFEKESNGSTTQEAA
ncbi:MAG: HU family DNA-binding protein [Cyclobacteriaceae bacterium]